MASCELKVEDIKPLVKSYLAELHQEENRDITESQFLKAHAEIESLVTISQNCADYHHQYELANYDFSRWGELSDRYQSHKYELQHISMQLKAGYESFEMGFMRSFGFNVNMWEKIAKEYYEKTI